ncbi:MAG: hypothetical protein ABIR52_10460 [Casimicrobiaceae bacterium]
MTLLVPSPDGVPVPAPTPGLGESISDASLYDETIRQQKTGDTSFAKVLADAGIMSRINVIPEAKAWQLSGEMSGMNSAMDQRPAPSSGRGRSATAFEAAFCGPGGLCSAIKRGITTDPD